MVWATASFQLMGPGGGGTDSCCRRQVFVKSACPGQLQRSHNVRPGASARNAHVRFSPGVQSFLPSYITAALGLLMLAKGCFSTRMEFLPKSFLEIYVSCEFMVSIIIKLQSATSVSPYLCITYGDLCHFLLPTLYILSLESKPPSVGWTHQGSGPGK